MAGKRKNASYDLSEAVEGVENSAKQYFAKQLYSRMLQRGWTQSELARRAAAYMPKPARGQKQGHGLGRDLVSNYIRGLVLPRPATLRALARALECQESELLPPRGVPQVGGAGAAPSPFTLRELANGMVYLSIGRELPRETALQIVGMMLKPMEGGGERKH